MRIRFKVAQEDVHTVNEQSLKEHLLSLGAADVRIEKSVVPKQIVRAAGISTMVSLEGKFGKWAETTGTPVTESLAQKLALLELPREVLFLEMNLEMPNNRRAKRS